MYGEFRFSIIGFGSVILTEISVSVVSVFTRFGRSLIRSVRNQKWVNVYKNLVGYRWMPLSK